MKEKLIEFVANVWPFVFVVGFLCVCALICGCSSAKRVTVVHDTICTTNTEYVNRYLKDSVYVHDSVWMTLKGDTVWMDRWHTKYVSVLRHDTLSSTDTIYQVENTPYEVVKIKTRYLWWPSLLVLTVLGIGLLWVMKRKK